MILLEITGPEGGCRRGLEIVPVWQFNPSDGTIWCRECEDRTACGISTIGPYGRGYWPPGISRPVEAGGDPQMRLFEEVDYDPA